MTIPESTYAKPFLTLPAQIRRLRERGMECGTDEFAAGVLQRYGYYRLSGYWHLYRARPEPPAPRFDDEGREVRLESFVPGTSLAHVVSLYEFDHELRTRLGDALSTIETAFRFFIGHRLGRVDAFAHRNPEALGAVRRGDPEALPEPTSAYREWLEEYDRHEKRARGDFVVHFREKYGPHLPIWVATEVMSFGVLSSLYGLMRQGDQEVLAARFQAHAADGRGDRGALGNWLNNLRNVRNICAHYGRLWNRTFDVLIDAPGEARKDDDDPLFPLAAEGTNNKLYGVLLIMRHLLLSIAPERTDVIDIADFIEDRSDTLGFAMGQLGFPADWRGRPIWEQGFALDSSPMLAASLLDRVDSLTAPQARAALTAAQPTPTDKQRTPGQLAAAKRGAQKSLLRTYLRYEVVIEIELGGTKHYPAFQFRDGRIIDALAEINKAFAAACSDARPVLVTSALLDWWQTPHPALPKGADGHAQSPLDLLDSVSEEAFEEAIHEAGAKSSLVAPDSRC
ncbi:Abi family protein [Allosaccharopolyspora coralli]|uniref:Abi family protein n=1 Tax=Allosaccharopolyspora coralli TaxID=2665642 RepID=A0A5Q3QDH7_9PSEU|nr:Abi family protein [Allosaccharopolyspora coralli]QGK68827.1 Abi family protein [Allosaccharopolyspora coralli]